MSVFLSNDNFLSDVIWSGEPSSSANFDYLVHQFITEVGEGSAYRSDVQFNEADDRVLVSQF